MIGECISAAGAVVPVAEERRDAKPGKQDVENTGAGETIDA